MSGRTIYPPKVVQQIKILSLSEFDFDEVMKKGEFKVAKNGTKTMSRKYKDWGYELGLLYKEDHSGDYVILSVWKRDRR